MRFIGWVFFIIHFPAVLMLILSELGFTDSAELIAIDKIFAYCYALAAMVACYHMIRQTGIGLICLSLYGFGIRHYP